MIKESGLLKLAGSDPEVRKAILTLSKVADEKSEKPTEFNESVPAADNKEKKSADENEGQGEKQPPKEAVATQPITQPIPSEGPSGDAATDGARAAQAFLQPAFEAASQGDETAQKTLAMAAGEVARGVAEATNKMPVEEGTMPPEAMMPAQSPEEQVADQFVAQPQAAPAAVPQGAPMAPGGMPEQFKQSSDLKVSMSTVEKLIKMAKMDII